MHCTEIAVVVHIEPDSNNAHWQSQLTQEVDRITHPTRTCVGLSPLLRLHAANLQYNRYVGDTQMYVDWSGARDGEGADAVCRVEYALIKQLKPRHQIAKTYKTSHVLVYADVTLCHHRPSVMIDYTLTMLSQVSQVISFKQPKLGLAQELCGIFYLSWHIHQLEGTTGC